MKLMITTSHISMIPSSVVLLNSGGYTLTAGWIFPYAMTLMSNLRAEFSMEKMNMDPKNSFGVAKKSIIGNVTLKTAFRDACKKNINSGGIKTSVATIDKVYNTLIPKVLHSRYGQIIRRWRETNVKSNDKQAFRSKLKAATAATKRKAKSELKMAESDSKRATKGATKAPGSTVAKVTPPSQVDIDATMPPQQELVGMYLGKSAVMTSPNKESRNK